MSETFCFDIDGTISAAPKAFGAIMKSLFQAGQAVYPLTGTVIGFNQTGEDYRIAQLKSFGLTKGEHYTDVVVCEGVSPEDCGEMKGKFCKDNNVVFMVEDTQIYIDSIRKHSPGTLNLKMA